MTVTCLPSTGASWLTTHYKIKMLEHWFKQIYLLNVDTIFFLFQLIIEAVRGNGYKGDIAVDDITLTNTACPSKLFYLYFKKFNNKENL